MKSIRQLIVCIVVLLACSLPFIAGAEDVKKYTPLTDIKYLDTVQDGNIADFINFLVQWTIAVAAALAVIMILWGGLERMTHDSIQKQTDGTKRIEAAVWGLIIALTSYLLLYTINPKLVNLNFFTDTVETDSSSGGIPTGYYAVGPRTAGEIRQAEATPTARPAADPNFNPTLGSAQDMRVRSTYYYPYEKYSDKWTDKLQSSTGVQLRYADANTVGVVAVDPNLIPYGSLVTVQTSDGPRYYIAADTGGAVKSQTASNGTAPVVDFFSRTQVGGEYDTVTVTPYTGSNFRRLSGSQKEAFFDINKYKK